MNEREMREMLLKEHAWQGRMGGMDQSVEIESKESIRLRKSHKGGEFPPIQGAESDDSMVCVISSRVWDVIMVCSLAILSQIAADLLRELTLHLMIIYSISMRHQMRARQNDPRMWFVRLCERRD